MIEPDEREREPEEPETTPEPPTLGVSVEETVTTVDEAAG